jgi:hypothetical protein
MAASAPYGVPNFHTVRDAILALQLVVSLMRAAGTRHCPLRAGSAVAAPVFITPGG